MNIEEVEVKRDPRIVFMGTPTFSVPILDALIKNYKVKAVVTQPDKQVGRSGKIAKPPIKILAEENNILVIQLDNIKESYQQIIDLDPDLIVTCAYGQILPKELLDYPKYGCINVHASLLPKYRGGAPIHRAIINGDTKTGITIMYMAEGMDSGDIISQKEIEITNTDTASTLHDKLKILGKDLLLKTLPSIINKTNNRIVQNHSEATYAFTIKKEDEKLDFNDTKKQVYNKIRGLNSFPGAYCMFLGKRLKVWDSYITDNYPSGFNGEIVAIYKDGIGVKVSNGEIVFKTIQLEGKNKMSATTFVNGLKDDIIGKVLQ